MNAHFDRWLFRCLPAAMLTLGTIAPPHANFDHYQDTKFGFRFEPPNNWKQQAVSLNEPWIIAKFQCDKIDVSFETAWGTEHRAELLIFGFPAGGGEKNPFKAELKNPQANYTEYLQKRFGIDFHYEVENRETPLGSTTAIVNDVAVPVNDTYPRHGALRIVSWTYHLQDVDIVIQIEVVANALAKRRPDMDASFKSFKSIPRAEAAKNAPKTAISSFEELQKLTPEERKSRRVAMAEAAYAKVKAGMPQGWTASFEGRFYVLSHTDQKFVAKITGLGTAIFDWLDKNLEFIGKGEFVRKPILRICAESVEYQGLRRSEFWWGGTNLEIVTYKDEDDGSASSAFHDFNKAALRHWLSERDAEFEMSMPPWLAEGLYQLFEYSRIKEGNLIFPVNVRELDNLRDVIRAHKAVRAREMLTSTDPGPIHNNPDRDQHAALARFFLAGLGSKDAKYRDLFHNYIKSYRWAIGEIKKEGAAPIAEEGEAGNKNRREFWNSRVNKISDKAAERAFASMREPDWKALELDYYNSITIQ